MDPKKDTVVHTRFPQDAYAEIRKVASKRGVSKFIRDAVIERLRNVSQEKSPKDNQKR